MGVQGVNQAEAPIVQYELANLVMSKLFNCHLCIHTLTPQMAKKITHQTLNRVYLFFIELDTILFILYNTVKRPAINQNKTTRVIHVIKNMYNPIT